MKGIILAGGTGSRLYPCTKVTNKHLLPVYNKPMIYYPLQMFADAGIKEVSISAARRFGCAVTEGDKVVYVEEKPRDPKSNLAMTGLYMFDANIFNIIKTLRPSERGEFEITDAIDYYVKS